MKPLSNTVTIIERDGWHIATKESRHEGFLAWAKRTPIKVSHPLEEPDDEEVWFEFGPTPDAAVENLLKSLPSTHGVLSYLRSLRRVVRRMIGDV